MVGEVKDRQFNAHPVLMWNGERLRGIGDSHVKSEVKLFSCSEG